MALGSEIVHPIQMMEKVFPLIRNDLNAEFH
jgi:hypothetical protein